MTIEARSLHALLHPTFDPTASYDVIARGVAASPGAAKGAIVFTAPEAVTAAENGRDVILVRPFTKPTMSQLLAVPRSDRPSGSRASSDRDTP